MATKKQPGKVRTRHSPPAARRAYRGMKKTGQWDVGLEKKLRASKVFAPVLPAATSALLITVSYKPDAHHGLDGWGRNWHAKLRGGRDINGRPYEGRGVTAPEAVTALFERVTHDAADRARRGTK